MYRLAIESKEYKKLRDDIDSIVVHSYCDLVRLSSKSNNLIVALRAKSEGQSR